MKTEKLQRYSALPLGIFALLVIGAIVYGNYTINSYTFNLYDSNFLEFIKRYFSPLGQVNFTYMSVVLFSIVIYIYISQLEKIKNPIIVEKYILKFFDKLRFINVGKKMHTFLIGIRTVLIFMSMMIFVLLTALNSTLGTGLSPTLEVVNPDYYVDILRYFLLFSAFFEISNTFFVKSKYSVSNLFLLNIFVIPVLSGYIMRDTFDAQDIITNNKEIFHLSYEVILSIGVALIFNI